EELDRYLQEQGVERVGTGLAPVRMRLEALKALYMEGAEIDWSELFQGEECHCVSLPTYAWQRERLWPDWLDVQEISTPPEERVSASRRPISNTIEINGREVVDVLTELWADVLGLEKVNAFDSFFALGGHSLQAQSLLARIREVFQVELARKDFLAAPKPSACAALIRQAQEAGTRPAPTREFAQTNLESGFSALPQVEPDPKHRYEPFPLTDLQQAYWVGRTDTFALGDISIHLYLEYESDQLDLERFSQAWNLLIKRH